MGVGVAGGVRVGVGVGVGDGVIVGVAVGVGLGVGVKVGVIVAVGVGKGVGDGVGCGVRVGEGVGVWVGMAVGVSVGIGVTVGSAVGVGAGVGVRDGVGVGIRVGAGVAVGSIVGVGSAVSVGLAVAVGAGDGSCSVAGVHAINAATANATDAHIKNMSLVRLPGMMALALAAGAFTNCHPSAVRRDAITLMPRRWDRSPQNAFRGARRRNLACRSPRSMRTVSPCLMVRRFMPSTRNWAEESETSVRLSMEPWSKMTPPAWLMWDAIGFMRSTDDAGSTTGPPSCSA